MLLFSEYVKAGYTGDKSGSDIKKGKIRLTMHNNTSEYPLGKVMLYVSCNGFKHHLQFFIVDCDITPILGRDSCIGMKLVQILYSGIIIYLYIKCQTILELPIKLTQDGVLKEYTDVFTGMGELAGDYSH